MSLNLSVNTTGQVLATNAAKEILSMQVNLLKGCVHSVKL